MYDVIVVGARVAGAPTAMLLARRGHRVLLVDRTRFPSDTLSTHFLHLSGVAHLHDWGVLDAVRATGCPPIATIRFDAGPVVLRGAPEPAGTVREMFCCRRTVLDATLVAAAAAAGAEVREGCTVEDLLIDGGRVTGIRTRTPAGVVAVERARVVVGADGRNSKVARWCGAAAYREVAPLTCAYYTYIAGADVTQAEFCPRPGRAIAAMPTNDGLTCVFVSARRADFHAVRRDVGAAFDAALALVPGLAARLATGRRVEPFRGTGDLPNFLRRPAGAGWALVGDAGCHKDPLPAHGISDAFRDAQLLADALHRGLSGAEPLEAAMAAYARARDAAELPRYGLALDLARLEPPSAEFAAALGRLENDSAGTARFLGTFAGTVPIADAFGGPAAA